MSFDNVLAVCAKPECETLPVIIKSAEDTYVIDGDEESGVNSLRTQNFSHLDTLHFKADGGNGKLYRRVLLKFDISPLLGTKPLHVFIYLFGTVAQEPNGTTVAHFYEVEADSWQAATVTFDTAPQKGEYITSAKVGKSFNCIDITEVVLKRLGEGKRMVSLMIDGDNETPFHVAFASSRSASNGPTLVARYTNHSFVTDLCENSAAIWSRAAEMVKEWAADWNEIRARGDYPAECVFEKAEEYGKTVDVTRKPNLPYTAHATRTLDSVQGYVPSEALPLDEYGGCICDKKFEPTGWFHVEEKGGRFWAVTPNGNPFYRMAMVTLSPGGEGRQRAAVLAKCGDLATWAKRETEFLREDLGYNSLGGWSAMDLLSRVEKPMALTHIVGFISVYARLHGMNNSKSGNTTFVGGVMPVFDSAFAAFADTRACEVVTPYAQNPCIYGWMGDNELHCELKMLDAYLMADITNPWFVQSYATAWTFLRTVTGKEDADLCDVTDEHRKLFRAMVYNRYFRVIATAVKKYAPHHMFLGSRFLAGCYRDEYVQRVAGKWCDVISFNYYGAWTPDSELMQNIVRWSGRPFMITEWYAKGMDVQKKDPRLTNESGAGFTVKTQTDRGYFYQNYTLKLMECKGCVGFDWFKMWDNDPDNLKTDLSNRNSNKGIYDNDYEPYSELICAMRAINKNCYSLIDFFDADRTRSHK